MEYMQVNRANDRAANELRPVKLTRGVMKHAHGSCLAEFGDTRVLCAATIEEGVRAGERELRPLGDRGIRHAAGVDRQALQARARQPPRVAPWRSSASLAAACVPLST